MKLGSGNLDKNETLKLYTQLVDAYLDKPTEHLLKKASEMGKGCIKSSVALDEILKIHKSYIKNMTAKHAPEKVLDVMMQSCNILLRILSEYGAAYEAYKQEEASKLSSLDRVNRELKKDNDELALLLEFSGNLNKVNSIEELQSVTYDALSKLIPVKRLEITLDENQAEDLPEALVLPIIFSGEKYATFILHGEGVEKFRGERKQFMELVINQLSVAVERLNLYEELKILSITDCKTTLYNFKYYNDSIIEEIKAAERNHTQVALLMIDIDDFKMYNDHCGHDMGDLVMRQIGETLKRVIGERGVPARFGGEEFTVILPDTDKLSAALIAEQVRSGVKQSVVVHKNYPHPNISISVGVSIYPENGNTHVQLVKAADQALYVAKAAGKDQVRCAFDLSE